MDKPIKFKPSSTQQESNVLKVLPESVTPSQLHDFPKAEVIHLRRIAGDTFWGGGIPAREAMPDYTQRSAQRLAYRLARHRRERAAAMSNSASGD